MHAGLHQYPTLDQIIANSPIPGTVHLHQNIIQENWNYRTVAIEKPVFLLLDLDI